MRAVLWVPTILLLLDVAHSYILLTANMDDVQAIAKQMMSSPVANQIGKVWRRATAQFNQRLKRASAERRDNADLSSEAPASSGSRSKFLSDSFVRHGRRVLNELSGLSDNPNEFLQTLRRVFNEFTKQWDD